MLNKKPIYLYFKPLSIYYKNHFALLVRFCTFALPKKYKT